MSVESNQVSITSPCPIQLDRSDVTAGDRRLFCDHCTKDVHLLSHMTEGQARDFMRDHAGEDVCVSYAIKPDGGIRFRPEPAAPALVPISALRRRPRVAAKAHAVALGAVGAMLLAACAPHAELDSIPVRNVDRALQMVDPMIPTIPNVEVVDDDLVPCDDGYDEVVEGGLIAEPLDPVEPPVAHDPPEPLPEVAGGLRAMPIEDTPPPVPAPIKRGKIKAKPL